MQAARWYPPMGLHIDIDIDIDVYIPVQYRILATFVLLDI